MRKRLRKKLRKGEFQEMGFLVQFHLPANLDESGQSGFWDAFIGQAVEANGLMCGGGCGTSWDVFISLDRRGSATDDHRQKILCWLQDHPLVADVRIGPLVDAWHEQMDGSTI